MSTIWGIQHSRIVSGATTVELEHSIIEPNFIISDAIMHESVLTGVRTWSRKRMRTEFTVMEYLFKYANPHTKAREILALENTVVTFYLAIDGAMVQEMYLDSVDIYGLIRPYRYDVAVLNFKSKNWLNVGGYLKTKDGKYIKTADGKYIKTKGIIL
jgi:hypothetical protein